jgi:hypothetical protein
MFGALAIAGIEDRYGLALRKSGALGTENVAAWRIKRRNNLAVTRWLETWWKDLGTRLHPERPDLKDAPAVLAEIAGQ